MLPWEDLDSELKKNVGLQFSVITAGMDTGKKKKKQTNTCFFRTTSCVRLSFCLSVKATSLTHICICRYTCAYGLLKQIFYTF